MAKAAGGVVRNQPGHRASPVHDRYDFLPRKVWDDKNPDVRQFLLEQYAGRCQICTATFPKRDGNPYFEILYLVSHTSAVWIDRPGDVLCLCPTCISKFLHGEVRADDVLDQIRSWRTRAEGGAVQGEAVRDVDAGLSHHPRLGNRGAAT